MNVIDKLKGIDIDKIQEEALKLKVKKAIEYFGDIEDFSNQESKVLRKILTQAEKAIIKQKQPSAKEPIKPAPKYKRYIALSDKDIDNLSKEDCRAILKERTRTRTSGKERVKKAKAA